MGIDTLLFLKTNFICTFEFVKSRNTIGNAITLDVDPTLILTWQGETDGNRHSSRTFKTNNTFGFECLNIDSASFGHRNGHETLSL
jgi:hypothetical protein